MRLAVVAAGFTPGEADQLRRAMAAWRRPGLIDQFKQKLLSGMSERGLTETFAMQVFTQIRGFGEYGFPESHAASFALLVYVSCWLKHYYPEVFCAAILNSQPMGFYGPSQLVQDAQRHGVQVREPDINQSQWECSLEPHTSQSSRMAIRLGLRQVRGLSEQPMIQVIQERDRRGRFRDISDLVRRTRMPQSLLKALADAGCLRSLAGDRRAALWQALDHEKQVVSMPLFEAKEVDVDDSVPEQLGRMSELQEVYTDYQTIGLSLQGHPMDYCRAALSQMKVVPAAQLSELRSGKLVRVAGLVVLRQRPSTAKGITFVTLEDETGAINLVIRPDTWKRFELICKRSHAWLVHGVLETRDNVTHVIVGRLDDLTQNVGGLDVRSRDFR
jgi:error-prone DNA polymerase